MISFFQAPTDKVYAVASHHPLDSDTQQKLIWLFGQADILNLDKISGDYIGPRAAMVTPWSTNAVEITQNMAIEGISRIEEYHPSSENPQFDPMLSQLYHGLDQDLFTIDIKPEPIRKITDITAYNEQEGLALNPEEIQYLEELSQKLKRPLTDSEIFGFSQVNSEHCRHKIFNGTFVIDGEEKTMSLFQMIKSTSKQNPNGIVSAYKDNVAFVKGPKITQFAPQRADRPSAYETKEISSIISLKAETHNFPTTVEPFNGAATGSGGEIRDRLAGGKGAIPLAGTAIYMTSYSRLADNRPWENAMPERNWLYQTPMDILIKASNGASDFGNKFGQPLIAGSLLTFEHAEEARKLGFDKVIMLAGGIGYGMEKFAQKDTPIKDDSIVILGGDNYRIGMGGAAVSSADTGEYGSGIELNAVQRSNPEMQKRVANTIRALLESSENPIVSIHDHGAGGHLNCLSELVEETGGIIDIKKLPIGDPTLSYKEIIGNESQERMGLVISDKDLEFLQKVSERERSPMYTVGKVTGDQKFIFEDSENGKRPMALGLADMFGSSPKTIMKDQNVNRNYEDLEYKVAQLQEYLEGVLRMEAVACKDWLTNKVDRCVGGLVAKQQCVGALQLPLNNCGVMALDFEGKEGIATSVGHSPISGLVDARAGIRNSIAEALTNIVWAPLHEGLKSISLSANWMWPCRNEGEDARLYDAVEEAAKFAIQLGINIPTGKDSLSMAQKYQDETVIAPGTAIVSAAGHCNNIRKVVEPVFKLKDEAIYYINFSNDGHKLGGSTFAQTLNKIGKNVPTIVDAQAFAKGFNAIQKAILKSNIISGHDISAGGMITTLLEMCFPSINIGAEIDLTSIPEKDIIKLLFSENAGIIIQADEDIVEEIANAGLAIERIGKVVVSNKLSISHRGSTYNFDISHLRKVWYETSYLLDEKQTTPSLAKERYETFDQQPLNYTFPNGFTGAALDINPEKRTIKAAIIREKGSNSEREMANALYRAGFEVRDVHMTDLISGRETLEDIQFLGAVGGFSNSDVLGSAKGWAGSFKYNAKAREALKNFFTREDTLSVGICNGCQLFLELDLINPDHAVKAKMQHNDSWKHESAFTSVAIQENKSIMLSSLAGCTLGVWISHGEGKFKLPMEKENYDIVATYGYDLYPANPNGSDYNTAMICSADGRHLATMPHIERSFNQWNWANYPEGRNDEVSPWAEAFINARKWLEKKV